MTHLRTALRAAAAALTLAACGSAGSAGPAPTTPSTSTAAAAKPSAGASRQALSLAWVSATSSQSPAWMAYEGGYFRENGLDVKLEYIQASPTAAAAMVKGDVQFVQMAGPAVVAADQGGANQVMVMGFVNEPLFVLMTTADVTKPEDLKGKTVAVTKIGSSDEFLLRETLAHWGLKLNTDVKVTAVSTIQGRVAALSQRQAQGVMVGTTDELAVRQAGGHVLARTADLGIQYQAAGLATTRDFVQAHPDVVTAVAKSFVQGVHRYKTDKAFAQQIMGKYIKIDDPAALDLNYNAYVDVFPRVPAPSLEGMREVAKELESEGQAPGSVDVSTMVDASFVKRLDDSGFISQVYGV